MTRGNKQLRERWRTDEGKELRRAVEYRVRNGRTLDDLDIPEIDGRVDLRGIPFSAAFSEARGLRLKGLNLAGADVANITFIDCQIVDCVFDRSSCQFWRLLGTSVEDTTFVQADLRDSLLSDLDDYSARSVFARVDFTSANFVRCICRGATFVECDFSFAKFQRFQFYESALRQCRFRGSLTEVFFCATPDDPLGAGLLEDVDFSEATFREVDFEGLNLRRVTWPNDPNLLLVSDLSVLDRMVQALPSDEKRRAEAEAVLETFQRSLESGGSVVINAQDYPRIVENLLSAYRAATDSSPPRNRSS